MEIEYIYKCLWLAFVSLVGGVIGYIRKRSYKDKGKKVFDRFSNLLLEVSTSVFIAYITFELAMHFIDNSSLCVALAGLASFAGSDALVIFEKVLLGTIEKLGNKL